MIIKELNIYNKRYAFFLKQTIVFFLLLSFSSCNFEASQSNPNQSDSIDESREYDKLKSNCKTQGNDSYSDLKEKLEDIHVKDQTLRWLLMDAEKKFGRNSKKMNFYWQLITKQDSLNLLEVKKILNDCGWVGSDLVGEKGNKTLWLVIQHAPLEIQEKYLPLLKKSVNAGKSSGSHLALLEDRILMKNGKPQIYGSQVVSDSLINVKKVYKITEPEFVNERRAKVGLNPIEDYLQAWNIKWEIEQKEQNKN